MNDHDRSPSRGDAAAGRVAGEGMSLAGLTALAAVLTLAGMRVLVTFTVTGLDEASAGLGGGAATVGRTGAAVADALAVLTLVLALLDRLGRGASLHRALLWLWLIGAAGAGVSGWVRGDPSVALNWIGATALGLAAMHLADRPAARRIMVAAVAALLVPLVAEALFEVTYLHGQTVAGYARNRAAIAEARGWVEGGPAQRQFERRLYENTATGMFGLANVFASVLAGCLLVAAGAAVGLVRRRQGGGDARWAAVAAGALALLGVAAVLLTRSKGGVGALAIGAAMGGLVGWLALQGPRWRWAAPTLAVGLVIAAWLAIGARGAIGPPETAEGERSLLFRWYYVEAAGRMFIEAPGLGVGPGGFQSMYARVKDPLSPEDVAAPHSIFAAWGASIGVAGLAWAAMLLGMLGRAGRCAGPPSAFAGEVGAGGEPGDESAGDAARRRWTIVGMVTAVVFAARFIMQFSAFAAVALAVGAIVGLGGWLAWRTGAARRPIVAGVIAVAGASLGCLLLPVVGVWAVGAGGFFVVAGWLAGALAGARHRWVDAGLLAAATAVVLHAQIDMGLTNVMSAPLLMVIVGLAAGGGGERAVKPGRRGDWLVVAAAALMLPAAMVLGARGAGEPYVSPTERAWSTAAAAMADWRAGGTSADAGAVMAAIEDWLAMRPYDAQAHRRASEWAAELGRPDRAAAWLERALRLDERAYLDPAGQLAPEQRRMMRQRLERLRSLDSSR